MERLTKINGKYIEYSDENYNNSIDNVIWAKINHFAIQAENRNR